MRRIRFFHDAPLGIGSHVDLSERAARHAREVLRLKPGAQIALFNGDDGEFDAVVEQVSKNRVSAALKGALPRLAEPGLRIHLAQAISSGERMDYTLQKSVELGIALIQPLTSERSVVKLDADRAQKRREHWQGVITSATEQCGRASPPPLAELRSLTDWLSRLAPQRGVILQPGAAQRLVDLAPPQQPLWLLAGPEGGFSDREIDAALIAGLSPVSLGPRILRTETAALAALAAMQTLWGDF